MKLYTELDADGIEIRSLSQTDREIMPCAVQQGWKSVWGCVPGKGSASAAVGVSLDEPGIQDYPLSVTLLLHVTDLFSTSSFP